MTLVTIDIKNVALETHPDDRVVFSPPHVRERPDGGLVSTAETVVPLADGMGQVELVPGPVNVTFQCRGIADTRPKSGVVPDTGPVGVEDVIAGAFEYTPAVVNHGLEQINTARDEALGQVEEATSIYLGTHSARLATVEESLALTSLGSTNLDTLLTTKVWYQPTSTAPTTALGYPAGAASGILEVRRQDGTRTRQRWMDDFSGEIFFRDWTSGTWSGWRRVGTKFVRLMADTNLDALQSRMTAYQPTSSVAITSLGYPAGAGSGMLEVWRVESNGVVRQRWSDELTGEVFLRDYSSNAWSAWRKVANRAFVPIPLTSTMDLDTLTEHRRYVCTSSSTTSNPALHYPPGAVHGFLDFQPMAPNQWAQIWTEIWVDKGIAVRVKTVSGWQPWRWVSGTADISEALGPVIDRIETLESASASMPVVVDPTARMIVGGHRPYVWATPDQDVFWQSVTGQEIFPAGYEGEGLVGETASRAGYDSMLITKIDTTGLCEVTCYSSVTGAHTTIEIPGVNPGTATTRDDFRIVARIWGGIMINGVPQKTDLVSGRSNMEWAVCMDEGGVLEWVPWHTVPTAFNRVAAVVSEGTGAIIDVAAMAVGEAKSISGFAITQSVMARHSATGTTDRIRIDTHTSITPGALIQSDSVLTVLDDVLVERAYVDMTPVHRQYFTSMRVEGGSTYALSAEAPTVAQYTTIPQGAATTSLIFEGSEYFAAAAFVMPEHTWGSHTPLNLVGELKMENRANDPKYKMYPRPIEDRQVWPAGMTWRFAGQWRFGHQG